jgi:Fe-S oxidoreductase
MTLRDEFASLLPGSEARALARRAVTFGEWMTREKISLELRPAPTKAHVHGHCHEKRFGACDATLAALRQGVDLSVVPVTSLCCGMPAPSAINPRRRTSRAPWQADLMPAVRNAKSEELIVADGFSCRHQILYFCPGGSRCIRSVLADALPSGR